MRIFYLIRIIVDLHNEIQGQHGGIYTCQLFREGTKYFYPHSALIAVMVYNTNKMNMAHMQHLDIFIKMFCQPVALSNSIQRLFEDIETRDRSSSSSNQSLSLNVMSLAWQNVFTINIPKCPTCLITYPAILTKNIKHF